MTSNQRGCLLIEALCAFRLAMPNAKCENSNAHAVKRDEVGVRQTTVDLSPLVQAYRTRIYTSILQS